jgi:hypothetical protein
VLGVSEVSVLEAHANHTFRLTFPDKSDCAGTKRLPVWKLERK